MLKRVATVFEAITLLSTIFVIDEGLHDHPLLFFPRIIPWIHNLDANSRHAWLVLERPWYFTDYEYLHFVSRYLDLSIQESRSMSLSLFSFFIISFVVRKKKKNEVDGWVRFDRPDQRTSCVNAFPSTRVIHMLIDKKDGWLWSLKWREEKKDAKG